MPSTTSLMWSGRLLQSRPALAGFLVDVPAELRGDHDLVAERLDAFAENPLHLVRAIGFGRVVERDAALEGRPDDVDHLRPGRDRGLIGAAHVLDADADARNLQRSKPPSPNGRACSRVRWPAACAIACELAPARSGAATRLPAAPRKPRRPIFNLVSLAMSVRPSIMCSCFCFAIAPHAAGFESQAAGMETR